MNILVYNISMKNINKINKIKRNEIIEILKNPEIKKYFESIKVFGSSITDKCKEDSDIDLFVALKPEYINKKDKNTSYLILKRAFISDTDIFYAHEQKGKLNPKLYQNMLNGIEILD